MVLRQLSLHTLQIVIWALYTAQSGQSYWRPISACKPSFGVPPRELRRESAGAFAGEELASTSLRMSWPLYTPPTRGKLSTLAALDCRQHAVGSAGDKLM